MKTQNKKGFTIVELVIVIAVIAILAAVLIPTFINLTKKANESNLTVMVTNLNKSLRTYEALNGEQKTMHGAVLAAQDAGYDLVKLASEQSEPWIVYDPENREFVKEADVKDGEKAKYFKVYEAIPEAQTFSIYLSGEGETVKIDSLNVGFDAGKNVTSAVNYKGNDTANVTIRMNGGELTVNNPQATVNYYGEARTVTVEAVAGTDCFHVFGKIIGNLTAKAGKVTFEATANVSTFFVEGNIQIAYVSGAQIGTAIATNAEYLLTITNSQLPAECKSTIALTEDQKTQNALFAGGLGTEKSPYLIATAEQFVNIGKLSDQMKNGTAVSFKLVSDIDLSTVDMGSQKYVSSYICGTFDGNGHALIVNDSLNGVFGTAVNNTSFLNLQLKLFSNPVKLCHGVCVTTGANVLMDGVDICTVNTGEKVRLGQNVGLYFNCIGYDEMSKKWCDYHRSTVVIVNCNASADIIAESYNAVFVGGMLNNTDVTVKNSVYSGQYYGEMINLVYGNTCSDSGNDWISYCKSTMTIDNVQNTGGMYGTGRAALIAGGSTLQEASEHTTIKNCSLGTTRALTDASLGVTTNDTGKVEIREASATSSYYTLTFVGGARRRSEYTIDSSYRFSIRIEKPAFNNGVYTTEYVIGKMVTVEQYKSIDPSASFTKGTGYKPEGEDGAEFWIKEFGGTVYYVFMFDDVYYHFQSGDKVAGPAPISSVLVTIYDADGRPIAQAKNKQPK